ncbi:unnamed protein product [Musa acuminata subsp. burmannicoides]
MVVSTTFLAMGGSVSLHSVSTPLLTAAGCFALGCLLANAVLVIRIGLKMGKRKIAAAQCRWEMCGQVKVVLKIESDEDRFVLQAGCEQAVSLKIKDSDLPIGGPDPFPRATTGQTLSGLLVTPLEKYKLRVKETRSHTSSSSCLPLLFPSFLPPPLRITMAMALRNLALSSPLVAFLSFSF